MMSLGYVILHDDGARLEVTRIRLGNGCVLFSCDGYFEHRDACMMGRATVYGPDDTIIFSTWQGDKPVGEVHDGHLWMELPMQTLEVTKHAELDWRRADV